MPALLHQCSTPLLLHLCCRPVLLHLSRNRLPCHNGRAARRLELDYYGLGDYGATALAESLGTEPNREGLSLRGNNVGAHGICAIAATLNIARLQSLDLSQNRMGREGAEALADALARNTTIRSLALGGCQLGQKSIYRTLDALKSNDLLVSLDLSRNNISEASAVLIGKLAAGSESLSMPDLCIKLF